MKYEDLQQKLENIKDNLAATVDAGISTSGEVNLFREMNKGISDAQLAILDLQRQLAKDHQPGYYIAAQGVQQNEKKQTV